jgi:hypothetical protein
VERPEPGRRDGSQASRAGGLNVRRFWFQFDVPSNVAFRDVGPGARASRALRGGCGVTAHDEADALHLIQADLLAGDALPPMLDVHADVDIEALPDYIRDNMGAAALRGVWYPPMNNAGPSRN